jgi:hypothetical protein
VAGLDHQRAEKRATGEAFASLPLRLLAAPVVRRLSDDGLALLMLLHANWAPGPSRAQPGSSCVPTTIAADLIGCRRRGVASAFAELRDVGLIYPHEPAVRPGKMGGATPRAATWRIPSREAGQKLPPLGPGQRHPEGSWRVHNERLRRDVKALHGLPLRLLICVLTLRGRDRRGALTDVTPFKLSADDAANLLNSSDPPKPVSRASAARALAALVAARVMDTATPAAGRRPASYRFGRGHAAREKHLPKSESPVSLMRHKHSPSVPSRDTSSLRLTRDTAEVPSKPAYVSPGTPHEESHAHSRSMTVLPAAARHRNRSSISPIAAPARIARR